MFFFLPSPIRLSLSLSLSCEPLWLRIISRPVHWLTPTGFNRFIRLPLGFRRFHWMQLGLPRFHWVLPGFTVIFRRKISFIEEKKNREAARDREKWRGARFQCQRNRRGWVMERHRRALGFDMQMSAQWSHIFAYLDWFYAFYLVSMGSAGSLMSSTKFWGKSWCWNLGSSSLANVCLIWLRITRGSSG